jgi:(1->4)-alpha-D-glucan 1-alpha-D-glucosylmutase
VLFLRTCCYFERNSAGDFQRAGGLFPYAGAGGAASTHDLPTLAGWWTGRDITLRAEVGVLSSPMHRDAQARARAEDRSRLLLALKREASCHQKRRPIRFRCRRWTPALARAIAVFLARTPAKVMVVQLEDVLGMSEQVNLPGTTREHPNWRRKLPLALEYWPDDGVSSSSCAH